VTVHQRAESYPRSRLIARTAEFGRPTCQRCGIDVDVVATERSIETGSTLIHVECHGARDVVNLTDDDVDAAVNLRDVISDLWAFTD